MGWGTAKGYLQEHQQPLDPKTLRGLIQVNAADFSEQVPPIDYLAEIGARAAQGRQQIRLAQSHRCAWDASQMAYKESMRQIMDEDIGPLDDIFREIGELLPKVPRPGPGPGTDPLPAPVPVPVPTPVQLRGSAGSYPGHDPAVDCYLGWTDEQVQWGSHHGLPLVAPVDGVVQRYSFPTPIGSSFLVGSNRPLGQAAANYISLFSTWTCRNLLEPNQTMYVAVFTPNRPIFTSRGVVKLVILGHLQQGVVIGPVQRGVKFGVSWDSGIRFEGQNPVARAAHVHVAASSSGVLSPNGDMDGWAGVEAMGWQVTNVGRVPGPSDYPVPNLWCAGRRYADFTASGHAIPASPD